MQCLFCYHATTADLETRHLPFTDSLFSKTFEPHYEKIKICICENKDADQLRDNHYFLNTKFQASSPLLFLYSSVCVGKLVISLFFELVRKPHCWFFTRRLIFHAATSEFLAKRITRAFTSARCFIICFV